MMQRPMGAAVLLVLFACACGSRAVNEQRPVSKVITLLKDMVVQLQKEAKEDNDVKEEMDCWCTTGLKEKTAAISSAQDLVAQLNHQIEGLSARSSTLNTEIANINQEITHNTEALAKATQLRKEQLAEFSNDEKSMISSISAMKGAIETIGAKHEGSFDRASSFSRTGARATFLQQPDKLMEVIAGVQTQVRRHPKFVTAEQRKIVDAFEQSPEDFLADSKSALLQQGYNPEHTSSSGAVFGVLKGMKESFEKGLDSAQKDENRNQDSYESLKKAKDAQILAGQSLAETKSSELGNVDQRHAESNQNLKDTERTLAADQEFLANLNAQCANINAEFFHRTQTRQQEQQAVSKALAFLNSDDANDLYARTFKSAAFLQTGMKSSDRVSGARLLTAAAARSHDSRLAALASSILAVAPAADQSGAFADKRQETFDQIRESVQDMIDKLVTEKEDARKHKDFCIDNLNMNEADTDTANRKRKDHEYIISELDAYIAELKKGISDLKEQIFESHTVIKRAGEDRERQNHMFQITIADQQATKKLLEGALAILQGFYNKAALAQIAKHNAKAAQPAGAPPPPGFKSYKKSGTSGGVMGMMQQIISDAEAMADDAVKDEAESQTAYETLVNDTNEAVLAMQQQMTNKQENKALAQSDRSQNAVELKNTVTELGELRQANIDLHAGCDYALKNFDARNDARDDEISALKESINIFSGAKFAAFVQKLHH